MEYETTSKTRTLEKDNTVYLNFYLHALFMCESKAPVKVGV